MSQTFARADGEPIYGPITKEGEEKNPLSLGVACVIALESPVGMDEVHKNPKLNAGIVACERWNIARRIQNADGPVEISTEEITMVKQLISIAWGVAVVGQAFPMLEGNTQ